jgi:hypothetical protein
VESDTIDNVLAMTCAGAGITPDGLSYTYRGRKPDAIVDRGSSRSQHFIPRVAVRKLIQTRTRRRRLDYDWTDNLHAIIGKCFPHSYRIKRIDSGRRVRSRWMVDADRKR